MRVVVVVLALVVGLAVPAGAAADAVRGLAVLGTAGCRGGAGLDVTIRAGDEVVGRAQTSEDGAFRLPGPVAETYTVTVSPPRGYETATVTGRGGEEVRVVLPAVLLPAERVAGPDRVGTGVAASRRAFPDGAPVALVATAGAYADALVAAPLAARLGGPLLLVGRRSGPTVLEEVERLGAREVVVVGAVNGVTAVVQAELRARGLAVRRIAGETRFDTAALVARELGAGPGGEVAVATGREFADALSFAALAAAGGVPILLTEPDRLPSDTAEALGAVGARRTLVLGGGEAVSEEVAAVLPAAARVAGEDRYGTSAAIARLGRERGADLSAVYVATGANWPDALAAGPLAAVTGGPLLLVGDPGDGADRPARAFLRESLPAVTTLVALGGESALPAGTLTAATSPAGPPAACDA